MIVSAGLRRFSVPMQADVPPGMRTIRAYGQEEMHQKPFEHVQRKRARSRWDLRRSNLSAGALKFLFGQ